MILHSDNSLSLRENFMKLVILIYSYFIAFFIFINSLNLFFVSPASAESALSPTEKSLIIINQSINKIVLLQRYEGSWRPKNSIHFK